MITPEYKYEVTRTWYVTAKTTVEAISKSNQILHYEVHATKVAATKSRFVRLIEFLAKWVAS